MFKKILLAVVLVGGVVGCSDTDWKNKATQEEVSLISAINYNKPNSCNVSRTNIKAAISKRSVKPSEDTSPFKDIEGIVKIEEANWDCDTRTTTMQEFYLQVYNKELFPKNVEENKIPSENNNNEPTYTSSSDQNVVIVDNNQILSPKIIDEITQATQQCFSAKVKMIDIVEDKGYLTTEDYPEIMKLISKCKMNVLKNEIEKI